MLAHHFAAAIAAASLALGVASCTRADSAKSPEVVSPDATSPDIIDPDVQPIDDKPLADPLRPGELTPPLATASGQLSGMRAWIDAMPGVGARRTLIVTAKLQTPCTNSEASLVGVGGFGVTGRTYLARVEVDRPEICLTAMGEHDLRLEVALSPEQRYDDVAIRLDSEMALIPLEIAQ